MFYSGKETIERRSNLYENLFFRDIFSVLQKPDIFKILTDVIIDTVREITPRIECITGLDSRGFLFGPLLSLELNVPFVPIRKRNKLPGKTISIEYEKEYGKVCHFEYKL